MHANWARATVSSGGAGSLIVAGITGFPTPYQAIGTRPFTYTLLASGLPLEGGVGHMADATTFVRDRLLQTYDGSSLGVASLTAASIPTGAILECTPLAHTLAAAPTTVDAANTTGRLIPPGNRVVPSSTLAVPALRQYYVPWRLDFGSVITGLMCNVTTQAASGGQALMELYGFSPSGGIGALIDSVAAFAVDSTGFKSQSFIGGAKFLPPGWYLAGFAASLAVTITAHQNAQTNSYGGNPFGTNGVSFNPVDYKYETLGSLAVPSSQGSLTSVAVGSGNITPAIALMVQ